ncbi:hypothetical protein RUMOBE_03074 [Blautia obeum ATCC 29174]|uniref:Uncharacterized protein n=1 Tax=Blautia obeum ATCC 29174 TaxID=411459 RepID=A5ZVN1_9FIRM|nr:hypothetical protein RUMOBE_03074 [Blautia obeum ATCC 29174]
MKCCRDSGSIFYGVQRDIFVLGSCSTFGPDIDRGGYYGNDDRSD